MLDVIFISGKTSNIYRSHTRSLILQQAEQRQGRVKRGEFPESCALPFRSKLLARENQQQQRLLGKSSSGSSEISGKSKKRRRSGRRRRTAAGVGEDQQRPSESRGGRRRSWCSRKASRHESDSAALLSGEAREFSSPSLFFFLFFLSFLSPGPHDLIWCSPLRSLSLLLT